MILMVYDILLTALTHLKDVWVVSCLDLFAMRLFVDDSPQKKVRFPTLSALQVKLGLAKHGKPIGLDEKLKVDMIVIGSVAVDPKTGARLGKGEKLQNRSLKAHYMIVYCSKRLLLMLIGACCRLVELLRHPSPTVLIPALRTVGNIVTGDDRQTQSVIVADIIGPLIHLLQNAEFDIKKEAAWAISNATSVGSHEQIKYVLRGCIKPLCDLLICPDARIVTVCLEDLENILIVGEAEKTIGNTDDVNLYAHMIDEAEELEKIENLQSHDNTEIYEQAVKILETY
ncbi:hypothetical protein C5167_046630 [Papaver somniferum]|uniref:IBB domain-containing protein n=1 Tax=Papaver somniferum TaxID=3469 RepID=A0A4Y7LEC4_PAPSO|nr:hypothetical protein C5167_046630 [Papaver somniferum]